jgi:hypothetical protein
MNLKRLCQFSKWSHISPIASALPYNYKVIKGTTMVTDTTQDAQLRRTIQKTIEQEMPLQLLKRIVYEVRCEELGIRPDGWKLYPED